MRRVRMAGHFRYIVWKFVALMATSLLVLSCSGIDTPDVPHTGKYPVTISVEQSPLTRISAGGNNGLSLIWSESDMLRVTAVNQEESAFSNLRVSTLSGDPVGKKAAFAGFVAMEDAPQYCYFTYPASDAITVKDGKIVARYDIQDGTHKPLLYSKETYTQNGDIESQLKFAGAMLKVTIKNMAEGVCSLAFFGNQSEKISPLTITPGDGADTYTISSGAEAVSFIKIPVQQNGPTYISLPTVELPQGFSIAIIRKIGGMEEQSIHSFSFAGGNTSLDRGEIFPIVIDMGSEFDVSGFSVSDPSWRHVTNSNGLLTGTEVSFKMKKNGLADSRIEEWGAELKDEYGNTVRTLTCTADANKLDGVQEIVLNVANDLAFLKEGTYYFQPYYKAFGSGKQSIGTTLEMVVDAKPDVKLTIGGYTSYDKYYSGELMVANSLLNYIIYDVNATINVDPSALVSYEVNMNNGEEVLDWSGSNKITFGAGGEFERDPFASYTFVATSSVVLKGGLSYNLSGSRVFHLTGLPLETDFYTYGDDNSWTKVKNAEFSNKCITFSKSGQSALRSPAFNVPTGDGTKDLYVRSSYDGCGKNVNFGSIDKKEFLDIYVAPCSASHSEPIIDGAQCKRAEYIVSYEPSGYKDFENSMKLTPSSPALMYSANNRLYTKAIYKIKIVYSE